MSKSSAARILNLNQPMASQAVDPGCVGVAQGLSPKHVIDLNVDCGVNHIVQSDSFDFARELDVARAMAQNPLEFFKDPIRMLFPSSDHATMEHFKHRVGADQNKKQVLIQVEQFIATLKGTRSVRDEAMIVADELYTNGAKNSGTLYDPNAPDVRPGWVEFIAAADDKRVVLGCIDSYGALEISNITKRIQKCLQDGVSASINQNQSAGAGIGSYMVFASSYSMYIGVKEGEKTIVLCAFPLGVRHKEMMNFTKNLHTLSVK
jgi:hypothetical protein